MGFSANINGSAEDCKLLMDEADARMSQHLGGVLQLGWIYGWLVSHL